MRRYLALVALFATAECAREGPPANITPGAPALDSPLAAAIQRALLRDPVLRATSIRVSVMDGTVNLSGPVPNLAAKLRANQLVSSFKGASSIQNGLVVSASRADSDIAAAVNDAVRGDPATRDIRVEADARNGVVTIRGSAASPTQRELLSDLASRVAGVQRVDLEVDLSPASRQEAEISTDIHDRLDEDSRLDPRRVVIEVHGRAVSLSGVVGSLLQHDAAMADAWVPGVASVTGSDLRVDWLTSATARAIDQQSQPSDAHITDVVQNRLAGDARVEPPPKVSVEGGVVTLTGPFSDPRAERAAVRDAYRVRGVRRVLDRMSQSDAGARDTEGVPGVVDVEQVRAPPNDGQPVPASTIEGQAKENVFWDPRVGRHSIEVVVGPDGAVTLTGMVDTASEMRAAEADAIVAGAAHVIDRLQLATAPGR